MWPSRPDFFFRAGDPAPLTDFTEIRKIVETATNAQVLGDLAATFAWADPQPFVDTRRYAITGFCWGGAVVWMAAARYRNIKAGVAWYGRLTPPRRRLPRRRATGLAARRGQGPARPGAGPLFWQGQGHSGHRRQQDEDGAEQNRKKGDLIVYPEAQHGFHADYRDTYDAAAAADGWGRMLAWFRENGAAPGPRRGLF